MSIDPQARPTGTLLADALMHLSNLVRGEMALARAEIMESLRGALSGVGLMVAAVVMAATALNLTAAAMVAGLARLGLPVGWGAFLLGAGLAIAAVVLWQRGREALKPGGFLPSRTARNMRRDAETLKEIVK